MSSAGGPYRTGGSGGNAPFTLGLVTVRMISAYN
jgi:hypothetical protein